MTVGSHREAWLHSKVAECLAGDLRGNRFSGFVR